MKYIVSGATGFIGKKLIENLLKDQNNIIYALIFESEKESFNSIETDNLVPIICDLEKKDNDFSQIPENIDCFFHFAWVGVSPDSRKIFDVQFRNINITVNCLKLAKEKKAKKFIAPGSTNEYLYSGTLINKDTIPAPKDSYGSVKVALRYLQKQFCVEEKIDFMYIIITGIYSEYRRDKNIISYTIDSLLNNKSPSLTKCEQLWDYVHIDDVVEAIKCISKKGKPNRIYAIGHGDNWQLKNYIKIIHELINPNITIGFGDIPYNSEVLPMSCMDLTDLINDTGFKPKIDFKEGIRRVIDNWNSTNFEK